jgi:hypothetical protein
MSAPDLEPKPPSNNEQLGSAKSGVYNDPEVAGLLSEVAARMGDVRELDALRRSLRTMLALYDAKAVGGTPFIRYKGTEQQVNLPGAPLWPCPLPRLLPRQNLTSLVQSFRRRRPRRPTPRGDC